MKSVPTRRDDRKHRQLEKLVSAVFEEHQAPVSFQNWGRGCLTLPLFCLVRTQQGKTQQGRKVDNKKPCRLGQEQADDDTTRSPRIVEAFCSMLNVIDKMKNSFWFLITCKFS